MKLSNLTFGFLTLMVAVISSNAQERGRGDRERGGNLLSKSEVTKKHDQNGDGTLDYREKMNFLRSLNEDQREEYRRAFFQDNQTRGIQKGDRDADWAREAIERYRGGPRDGRVNPLDPEAVKRRMDYAVKEGLMTREQADKMMIDAKKRMEVVQREDNDRRGNNEGRGRESQSNDRQDEARKGYEIRRKRIEEGVRSGKIKREDAAKMLEDLRKRMEAAGRGGNNNARANQQRGGDRGNADYDALRKRIEAGVKSGRIKREDAGKMLEGIRKRMEAAKRGGGDKKEEGKQDPRIVRYRATEKEIAAAVKAGKLSKEDAQKKLIAVRTQLWSDNTSRSSQSKSSSRSGSSSKSRSSQSKSSQSKDSSRGYLGASVESSSKPKGLRIQQVHANTAAARAKLKKGDIILKMNGASVSSNSSLIGRLSKTKPGQKATLLVSSGGKMKTVQVQLGGSYSTRSSAQSGSAGSRSSSSPSRSSQEKSSPSKGSSRSRTPQRSSGTDWRKAIEERMKKAREDRERAERNSRDRSNDRGHDNRGEDMRKAWEERMKKAREAQEKANNAKRPSPSKGSSRSRTPQRSSGTDWRKAIEERMKKAREDRERAERNSRDRSNDRGHDNRGEDMRKAWEERMKKAREAQEKANNAKRPSPSKGSSRSRTPQRSSGTDWRKAIEERMKKAREDRERAERNSRDRSNDRGHDNRGEDMRKAWEERMKKAREAQEKANNAKRPSPSKGSSRSRTPQRSSGTDWRKAIEERMKKAREDRERAERNSRDRSNDRGHDNRGEDMRKAWEERMKQWRESRERDGGRDGRRPEAQRGPQGRGPQPGGSWRGGPGGRGPQSGGPGRGGPRGR